VSVKFNFDERGLQRAVGKAVNDAMKDVAKDAQRAVDRVHRSHSGRPVNQVMSQLRSAARSLGWKASDADLRPMAEAISEGRKVTLQPGKTR
jgi:hypothetical protein